MLILIDNYDSFTYNLYQQLKRNYQDEIKVIRNDQYQVEQLLEFNFKALVIGAGPSNPNNSGICVELVKKLNCPILGICLGHQIIAAAYGGKIIKAPKAMHGKTCFITHSDVGILRGLPTQFKVARYHSLIVEDKCLPEQLIVTAQTEQLIMGLQNKDLPQFGLQFHPESFLSEHGDQLIKNFLDYV